MRTNAQHGWAGEQPDIDVWYGGLVDGMRDASGQMYMRNRYYDPATGQFTQTDPIGIAGGLNVYGFADGDPVAYADPYGLAAEDPDQCRTGRACLFIRAAQALRNWRILRSTRNAVDDLIATRRRLGPEDLARPATPNGMSMPDFGTNVMRWGRGTNAARERMYTLTRAELREAGVTPQIAREWRDLYVNEVVAHPANPSARGRAELMQRALELLQ
jgi:RHS repeat-associated protein